MRRSYSEKLISQEKYRWGLLPRLTQVHDPTKGAYLAVRYVNPHKGDEDGGIRYREADTPLPTRPAKNDDVFPGAESIGSLPNYLKVAQEAGWGKGLDIISKYAGASPYAKKRGEKEPALRWHWENGEGLVVPTTWEDLGGEDPTLYIPLERSVARAALRPAIQRPLTAADLPPVLPPVDSHATRGLIRVAQPHLEAAEQDSRRMRAYREERPNTAATGAVLGVALSPRTGVLTNQASMDLVLAHKALSGRPYSEWAKWVGGDDRLVKLASKPSTNVDAILEAAGNPSVSDNLWERTWDDPLELYAVLLKLSKGREYETPGAKLLREAHGDEITPLPHTNVMNINRVMAAVAQGKGAVRSPGEMRALMDATVEAGGYYTSLMNRNPEMGRLAKDTPGIGAKTLAFASLMYGDKGMPVDRHFGASVLGAWGLPPYSVTPGTEFVHDALGKWYEDSLFPYWRAKGALPEDASHFGVVSGLYSGILGLPYYVPHYPYFEIPGLYMGEDER